MMVTIDICDGVAKKDRSSSDLPKEHPTLTIGEACST